MFIVTAVIIEILRNQKALLSINIFMLLALFRQAVLGCKLIDATLRRGAIARLVMLRTIV